MAGFFPPDAAGGSPTIKDTSTPVGTRPAINFIEGANVNLTVADDPANNEVDITIAASVTGASGVDISEEGGSAATVTSIDFVGSMVTASSVGAAGTVTVAHGNQGGGSEHAAATTSVAGFMSSADKSKLDGIAANATNGVTTQDEGSGGGANQTTLNFVGAGVTATSAGATTTVTIPGGISDGDKGDVTVSASGATWTIDNNAVTYAKVQDVSATDRLLGRVSSGAGDIEEVVCTDFAQGLLDDVDAAAARTTLGAAASSHTHTSADITDFTEAAQDAVGGVLVDSTTIDFTYTDASNQITAAVIDDSVSNAKLANMAQSTFKGRAAGAGTGDPTDLTATQATAILDVFTSSAQGVVPASGGGTTNFLRADGSWTAPPGGGGGDVSTDTIWDAKGDLAVGTGSNTAAKLAAGTNGQVLTADSAEATGLKWTTVSGSGDVVGPASSTDNAVARFDLATGKLLQNSTVTIDDSGNIATSGTVDGRDVSADGAKLDGIESGADVTDATNVAAAGALMSGASAGGDLTGTYPNPTLAAGSVNTAELVDAAVTLAKMANLAQDQFIGRTTASTGVPQTATITAAARTVLDDATVGGMVNTLGGASSTGTGGLVRATSPTLTTPTLGAATATSLTLSTDLAVADGGTGASDAATARTNLGIAGIPVCATFGDGDDTASVVVGQVAYVRVGFAGTITRWDIVSDVAITGTIDVWKDTTLPTNADSIAASAKPALTTATNGGSSTLTGWTTSVSVGDIIGFELEALSSGTPKQITITMMVA